MGKKFFAVLLIIMILLSGCGGTGKVSDSSGDILNKSWSEIEKQASGTEVRMFMWGGDANVNRYMDDWVAPQLKKKYNISFTRVPMNAPDFMQKLLTEKNAGASKGTMDIIWINGENFKNAKTNGLLSKPFVQVLPNYNSYIDTKSKNITTDFGVAVDGMEAPWGRVQFVYLYDSAKVTNPPKNFTELADWVKAHPGKFTYPDPTDFTGNAFLRHLMYDTVGTNTLLAGKYNEELLNKNSESMWTYLNRIKSYLWRRGETYPQSLAQLDQLFSQGEIWFTMGYNEGRAEGLIRQGVFPKTTKSFIMDSGSIGNTHFLAIPYNCPNMAGALVTINYLLSPEAQLAKLDPDGWGDNTVLDINKLPKEYKQKFTGLNRGESVLPAVQLQKALKPEVGAEYVDWVKEKWMSEVIEKE